MAAMVERWRRLAEASQRNANMTAIGSYGHGLHTGAAMALRSAASELENVLETLRGESSTEREP
jgi:hypothetical protein